MSTKADVPVAPPGHYFFVFFGKREGIYGNMLRVVYVSICRRRKWWFDKEVVEDTSVVASVDDTAIKNIIRISMECCLRKFKDKQAEEQANKKRKEVERKFGGCYPPKMIN